MVNTVNQSKNRRKRNQKWFNDHLEGKKCAICEEGHRATLEYHHPEPYEKKYAVGRMVQTGYSIQGILKEIEKCVLVCRNCHAKIHYHEDNKH